jgi:hypothetical protein
VRRAFVTVPSELLQVAEVVADHFEVHGHKLDIEPNEFGYPSRPTLRCVRQDRTIFVEVDSEVRLAQAKEWASFARSQPTDTRVAVAVPAPMHNPNTIPILTKDGIGLYVCDAGCEEVIAPTDQTLKVGIPSLASQRRPVQRLLGQAYEKIRRGEWQDGFDDACQALEQEARKHLVRGVRSGRVVINRKSGPLTVEQIRKMSIGSLAQMYARIPNQTGVDRVVGDVLTKINFDRVTVAHHRGNKRREARLKRDWMGHMWRIVPALNMLAR